MQENEVPEKIQIHFIKNDYNAWSVRGYSFLEDKQIGMTEYIRTDAFLEKAKEWFIKHTNIPQEIETDEDGEPLAFSYAKYTESRFKAANRIFKDFERYMKGE